MLLIDDPKRKEEFLSALETEVAEIAGAIDVDGSTVSGRAAAVVEKINKVDANVQAMMQPYAGYRLVTHHDAFSRFAERYGVEIAEVMRPVDAAEPTPGEINAVREALSSGEIRGVFTEPQYNGRELTRIASEIGIPIGELDPLGTGDWGAMMRSNAEEMVRVFESGG